MPKNSQWCDVRAGEGEEAHTTCCHTEPKPPWHPGVSQPAHTKQRAAGLPQHRPVAGSWYKCQCRCGAGRRFRSSRLAAGKWRERGWRELIVSLPRGRNRGLGTWVGGRRCLLSTLQQSGLRAPRCHQIFLFLLQLPFVHYHYHSLFCPSISRNYPNFQSPAETEGRFLL